MNQVTEPKKKQQNEIDSTAKGKQAEAAQAQQKKISYANNAVQEQEYLASLKKLDVSFDEISRGITSKKNIKTKLKTEIVEKMTLFKANLNNLMRIGKNLSIRINPFLNERLTNYDNVLNELGSRLQELSKAGFCGKGNIEKQVRETLNELARYDASLKDLHFYEPLEIQLPTGEIIREVRVEVPPSEDKIRALIAKNIKDFIPKEEKEIIPEPQPNQQIVIQQELDPLSEAHRYLYGFGVPPNYIKALSILKELHKQGEVQATNLLGYMYLEGIGVKKDLEMALQYYERSAHVQDPEGYYRMGQLYEKGIIAEEGATGPNYTRAVEFYMKAAQKEHLEALTDLGYMYENGIHVEKSLEEAYELYSKAEDKGHPRAINNIGMLYYTQKMQEKIKGTNYQEAALRFRHAAEQGHPKAMANLGCCYEKGHGVPQDLKKARELFQSAADKGDLEAKFNLAYFILKDASSTNRDEDYALAVTLLREVTFYDPGNALAFYYLGFVYEHGLGVDKDYRLAIKYYQGPAKLNHVKAWTKLGNLYNYGLGLERPDKQFAMEAYLRAAEKNDAEAINNLGIMYEEGNEVVPPDHKKAFEMFSRASQLGNTKAMLNLGLMYEKGVHVKKDPNEAINIFAQAAEKGNPLARSILKSKKINKIYEDNPQETIYAIDETILLGDSGVVQQTTLSQSQTLPESQQNQLKAPKKDVVEQTAKTAGGKVTKKKTTTTAATNAGVTGIQANTINPLLQQQQQQPFPTVQKVPGFRLDLAKSEMHKQPPFLQKAAS